MRIDSLGRTVSGGAAARSASSGGFSLSDPTAGSAPRSTGSVRSAPSLDALIALQALQEDPRERRRREVARGRGLLDALDGLKLALIDGSANPEALSTMARGLQQRRDATGDAGLDDALAAIDLRARVELAKRGR